MPVPPWRYDSQRCWNGFLIATGYEWFMHQTTRSPSTIRQPRQSGRVLWTGERSCKFLNTSATNTQFCEIHDAQLCRMFLKHQNFNMILQISPRDKKGLLLFGLSSQNQHVMLLLCRPVRQTPRPALEQGGRTASLFHLSSLNKSLPWLVSLTSNPKDILNTAFHP